MSGIVFRDLNRQYLALRGEMDAAIQNVLSSGRFIGGSAVSDIEVLLADYVGVRNCVTCANGTDALQLVLMALGVGTGDAVFIPDFTFFATGEIVPPLGATPIFVDVDFETFNMRPESLERSIQFVIETTDLKPSVVIPVDLFGLPADYYQIERIARRYGLKILEDAAQSFGSAIGKRRSCSFGDAATTSFFPAKPLGCYGDGGAVFTDDDCLADLIRSLRVHGQGAHKYENIRIGMNSRLDALQAAVLSVKFDALVNYELEAMERIHESYSDGLCEYVEVPHIPEDYYSCNAQYTIKLPNNHARDRLILHLKEQMIPTMIYYPIPMHRQIAFADSGLSTGQLPVSDLLCKTVLSLPMHPYLKPDEVEKVVEAVKLGVKDA